MAASSKKQRSGATLAAFLRTQSEQIQARRAEVLLALADALEKGNGAAIERVALVARDFGPDLRLLKVDGFPDGGFFAQTVPINRSVAQAIQRKGKEVGSKGDTALASALGVVAFSFTNRGIDALQLIRFSLGLEVRFASREASFPGAAFHHRLASLFGPTVTTQAELARLLLEAARPDAIDAAAIARVVTLGSERLGTFPPKRLAEATRLLQRDFEKTSLPEDAEVLAVRVLRVLGMEAEKARALMALAVPAAGQRPGIAERPVPAAPPSAAPWTSYLLSDPLPTQARKRMAPWLLSFWGTSPAAARKRLAVRFSAVPKWLVPFRDLLSRGTVRAVVVWERTAFVEIETSRGKRYIQAPAPGETQVERLAALGFDAASDLSQLVLHFGGLRTSLRTVGGFCRADELVTFGTLCRRKLAWIEDDDDLRPWRDAVPAHQEPSSDLLLVHPNGRVGRWDHELGVVTTAKSSFRESVLALM